jgi:hypothetical protein
MMCVARDVLSIFISLLDAVLRHGDTVWALASSPARQPTHAYIVKDGKKFADLAGGNDGQGPKRRRRFWTMV